MVLLDLRQGHQGVVPQKMDSKFDPTWTRATWVGGHHSTMLSVSVHSCLKSFFWVDIRVNCKGNQRWMVLCTPSHCPWLVLLARLQHPIFKVHASHYIFRKIAEKRQKSPPLLPYLLRKNCSDYKLFWRLQDSTFSRVPLIKKVLQQNSFVHSNVYTK